MKKKTCKSRARSLANLVPGGNLRHGAFRFLRTGEIPPEHTDIGDEAQRFGKGLRKEYCWPENFILNTIQAVPIQQAVRDFVFMELLARYLWRQVSEAGGGDRLQTVLTSPGWGDWLTASNRMRRLFRQLRRNLQDFG